MKKLSIVFTICICFAQLGHSQNYDTLLLQAQSLMKEMKYEEAASKWDSLQNLGLTPDERYLGVQCWALAHQIDKAFKVLLYTAKNTYCLVHDEVQSNINLTTLHTDKRWKTLLNILKKRSKNFDAQLMNTLQIISISDQSLRRNIDSIGKAFGWNSPQLEQAYRQMHFIDSVNVITVAKIIDSVGWLGRDRIGEMGTTTLFLVIQHSNIAVQKKYLPYLKEAHRKKCKIRVYDIGYLEDRIAVKEKKPQKYGTQLTRVDGKLQFYPIEDVKNVNKRRKKLSMGPIEEYAKFNNISF